MFSLLRQYSGKKAAKHAKTIFRKQYQLVKPSEDSIPVIKKYWGNLKWKKHKYDNLKNNKSSN